MPALKTRANAKRAPVKLFQQTVKVNKRVKLITA